ELATVGPYLNALPKEKKESLLEKFAEKYFGRKNDDTDVELLSASQWIPLKGISTNRFLKLIEYIAKIVRP
ncbi:MAG: hypothetical protein LBT46_08105, partial [Planctomycetaceae bacterium]|nr:hypothetical protein [Planctomycetaceae bacterium]